MKDCNNCLMKQAESLEIESREFGFYWENLQQIIDQIQSECREVDEAWKKGDRVHLKEEVGDLMHAVISLAVFCQLELHETLSESIEKYRRRFHTLMKLAREDGLLHLHQQPFDVLMHYWNRSKTLT